MRHSNALPQIESKETVVAYHLFSELEQDWSGYNPVDIQFSNRSLNGFKID